MQLHLLIIFLQLLPVSWNRVQGDLVFLCDFFSSFLRIFILKFFSLSRKNNFIFFAIFSSSRWRYLWSTNEKNEINEFCKKKKKKNRIKGFRVRYLWPPANCPAVICLPPQSLSRCQPIRVYPSLKFWGKIILSP